MKVVCETKPEKAASRLAINSTMTATLFFILTLIWALSPEKFSRAIIIQLVLDIPLLYVSSFAYSKLGYWEKSRQWDRFGWITNTTANIFILNVVGLMTATVYRNLSFAYFTLTILLIGSYYYLHLKYDPQNRRSRVLKFVYFVVVMLIGGIMPMIRL